MSYKCVDVFTHHEMGRQSSSKHLLNTCTIDNFLMTIWCWYKENNGTLFLLRDADSLILREFDAVVSLMLTEHYDEARTKLLAMKNDPLSMKCVINSYDADYTYCLSPLTPLYVRSCNTTCVMSEYCREEVGERELTSMTLSCMNENILFRSIQEWLNGGCSALCPHVYDDLPAHGNVRIVTVNNVD